MPWLQAPFCLHLRTRGSWRKAPSDGSWCHSAQNHHLKKCLHQRRRCFSNSKGKTPGLMRLLPRFLAGLFLPHPASPCSIIIYSVLNQAKGADNKMQLRICSSGKMPRLRAGPTSRPLQSLAAAVAAVMAARIRVSRSHGRSCFRPSPELTSLTCSSSSPWGLMGWCGEQGYHSDTETEQTQLGPGDQGLNPACSSLAVCP